MIRKLFGVLLALVVVLIVIGFVLPTTVVVERSRVIDHSPDVTFEVLADLRHFTRWAPWLERHPDMSRRLEGPSQGVGATLVWRDTPESEESRLWIVAMDPTRRIDMKLELGDSEFDSWFSIDDVPAGTEVSWGMQVEFGALDLVGRYVGLVLPGLVGRDYRHGLERLDEYLSQSPGRVPALPEAVEPGA